MILDVGIPSAGHVKLPIIVQCSDVIRIERVKGVVVAVASDSHWRAIKVDNFRFSVVLVALYTVVGAAARAVDNVWIVGAAADVVAVDVIGVGLDESAVVVEVSVVKN